jgi:hypothetical protein
MSSFEYIYANSATKFVGGKFGAPNKPKRPNTLKIKYIGD